MVQRHHRLETPRPQRADDASVVLQCIRIPTPFGGFDTAPFDREAMRVVSPGTRHVEILLEPLVVATGFTGYVRQTP